MHEYRCIIMGAAGRDFHDFQTFFSSRPEFRVVCFTAEQIPFIDERSFPRELAGPHYDADIPIYSEKRLPELIAEHSVDFVFLAYSDLAHADVMHKACAVQAAGASFGLLGPGHTMLPAHRPVIAVTAVRTGAGKSPISQAICRHLTDSGRRMGVIRHPMPYGDLAKQRVQRFATLADLDAQDCTVEEREEYAPYVEQGLTIFAGVDYAGILAAAEAESDVILWDGGNNDTSFVKPGLTIVVADALRPGHEVGYYPGETNFRLADIIVITKVEEATPKAVEQILENVAAVNPDAIVMKADLTFAAEPEGAISGARVLVIEDGPTVTHGGRPWGAGLLAARRFGASAIIDPRPHAVGTLASTFAAWPHLEQVLPAMGYSDAQRADLAHTIENAAPDVVIDASPAGLHRVLDISIPMVRVRYKLTQRTGPDLLRIVDQFLAGEDWRAKLGG